MRAGNTTFNFNCGICGKLNTVELQDEDIKERWEKGHPCQHCDQPQPSVAVAKEKREYYSRQRSKFWGGEK